MKLIEKLFFDNSLFNKSFVQFSVVLVLLLIGFIGQAQTVTITQLGADPVEAIPQPVNNGRFRVTRTGPTISSLDVTIAVAGTATATTDYAPIATTVTIPALNTFINVSLGGVVDDALVEGDETIEITIQPNALYTVGATDTAILTIIDDDVAGVNVDTTIGTTTEAGGTTDFIFTLTSEPTANVTIPINGYDATETSGPASVVLTPANWDTGVTLMITGLDDAIVDGDITDAINTGNVTSTDINYGPLTGIDVPQLQVTNTDDDVAGVNVDTITGTTTEAGGTTDFVFTLTSEPIADVNIPINGYDVTENTGPVNVVLTPANWDTGVTLTITGVDDAIVDGDITDEVNTGNVTSLDPVYDALVNADVPQLDVTNTDDDLPGVNVDTNTGTTTEAGGTTDFVFTLTNQPSDDVTISIVGYDATETSGPASVVLTPANWDTGVTLTITGVDDAIVDGDIIDVINTSGVTSNDLNYDALTGADVDQLSVTNTDDDLPGVNVDTTTGTTTEAGGTTDFVFTLTNQPLDDVTISIVGYDTTETSGPASVVLTPANWDTGVTLTITGVDDAIVDGDIIDVINTSGVTSNDLNYDALTGADVDQLSVTNTDDDGYVASLTATDAIATEGTPTTDTAIFEVDLGAVNTTGAAIPITLVRNATLSNAVAADFNGIPVVSVPVGAQTTTFIIEPIDDVDVEAIENLTLEIIATADYVVGSNADKRATMTIEDNDSYVASLTATDAIATEGTPVTDNATFEVDLGAVNTSGTPIPITIVRVAALSDAVTADYNGIPVVEVPVGSQTTTFIIDPIDDQIVEPQESLTLQINTTSDYSVGTNAERRATMNITDNDTATLSIEDVTVNEDNGSLVFTVTLDKAVSGGTLVSYTFANGTATGGGVDFIATGGNLSFAGTANEEETITVTIINDTELENTEDFTVSLGVPTNTGVVVAGTGQAIGTIGDDDNCAPTPILSPTAPSNEFCGDIMANLNAYTNTPTPTGMVLTWSISSDPLNAAGRITQAASENITTEGSFFGYFYDAANDCAGGVLEIELISNETPTIDATTGGSNCGPGSVVLSATASTGSSINWYDSDGVLVFQASQAYSTMNLQQTTSFFVEAEANGCISERVEVVATIIEESFSGVASGITACNLASTQLPLSTIDLDDRLLGGPDAGAWTFVSGPSPISISATNEVSFVGQNVGDYLFRYTTTTAVAPCANVFTEVIITVTDDCTPDAIDLEVLKTLDNANTPIGENVVFTITVNNLSPNEAKNVTISDLLKSGFQYVTSQTSFGSYDAQTGNWVFTDLAGNDSAVLTIEATVLQGGVHTNTASLIESFPIDSNGTNDVADTLVTIEVLEGVDLSIENTALSANPLVDDEVLLTMTVENLSDDATTINQIRVANPIIANSNFEYIFHNASIGTYDVITGFWEIPTLARGQEATLEITIKALNEGTYINTASIISSIPAQTDGNFVDSNNNDSVDIRVSEPVIADCGFVFNQFSPNGDGTNDVLKIQCIEQFPNNSFQIFDRYGSLILDKSNSTDTIVWDGYYKGEQSPSGTYFYILNLGDGSAVQKGWIQLIR